MLSLRDTELPVPNHSTPRSSAQSVMTIHSVEVYVCTGSIWFCVVHVAVRLTRCAAPRGVAEQLCSFWRVVSVPSYSLRVVGGRSTAVPALPLKPEMTPSPLATDRFMQFEHRSHRKSTQHNTTALQTPPSLIYSWPMCASRREKGLVSLPHSKSKSQWRRRQRAERVKSERMNINYHTASSTQPVHNTMWTD